MSNNYVPASESCEWEQPRGTFDVSAYANEYMEPVGCSKRFNSPARAIEEWFKLSKDYPTCVMITGYIEQEKALRQWAVENEPTIIEWADKYHCPYKTEYILDACKEPVRRTIDTHSVQLHPFDLG